MDKMREAFEQWAWESFDQSPTVHMTTVGGGYECPYVNLAWLAWQAATAQCVPEGWVVVPKKPTEAMTKAVRWDRDAFGGLSAWPSDIYRHMIQAAPKPGEQA